MNPKKNNKLESFSQLFKLIFGRIFSLIVNSLRIFFVVTIVSRSLSPYDSPINYEDVFNLNLEKDSKEPTNFTLDGVKECNLEEIEEYILELAKQVNQEKGLTFHSLQKNQAEDTFEVKKEKQEKVNQEKNLKIQENINQTLRENNVNFWQIQQLHLKLSKEQKQNSWKKIFDTIGANVDYSLIKICNLTNQLSSNYPSLSPTKKKIFELIIRLLIIKIFFLIIKLPEINFEKDFAGLREKETNNQTEEEKQAIIEKMNIAFAKQFYNIFISLQEYSFVYGPLIFDRDKWYTQKINKFLLFLCILSTFFLVNLFKEFIQKFFFENKPFKVAIEENKNQLTVILFTSIFISFLNYLFTKSRTGFLFNVIISTILSSIIELIIKFWKGKEDKS